MKELYCKKNLIYNASDVDFFVDRGFDLDFAQFMSSRGVTKDNYKEYLDKEYYVFGDPFLMKNMTEAVSFLKDAMSQKQRILVYGDYDADGLTASAILKLFFDTNGIDCDVLIPTRADGYGLHFDLVKNRYDVSPFDLIVTVDCGISNKDEIKEITEKLPVKVLVTDHHELPDVLPDCICINCKMDYPCKVLSGAGVALKLVQALSDTHTALKYSDLATVGTIADMMPLVSENRMIVRHGLKYFRHKGLKKLAEMTRCDFPLTANALAMKLCPKINSAGRVGDPMAAFKLLIMEHRATTDAVDNLINCNLHRQKLLEAVLAEAEKQIENIDISSSKMLFLCGKDWPQGILGIAANRFKETYGLSCAFLTEEGENYVGSARSNEGLNLFELFSNLSEHLVKFGGHSGSVGFTVSKTNYDLFKETANLLLTKKNFDEFSKIYYDFDFSPKWLNSDYFACLEYLEPLLPNERPLFFTKDFSKTASTFGNGHIRFTLGSGLEVKAFGSYSQYLLPLKNQAECNVVFYLEKDKYTGKICGTAVDLSFNNSLNFDLLYAVNALKNMTIPLKSADYIDDAETREILLKENTLILFDSYYSYVNAQSEYDFSHYTVDYFVKRNHSTQSILISPMADEDYSEYKNIISFARCFDFFEINFSKKSKIASFCLPTSAYLSKIYLDRKICLDVFFALKKENNIANAWEMSNRTTSNVSQQQFFAALKVFEELGIVSDISSIKISSETKKSNLEDSKFFNYFNTNSQADI